MLSGSWRSHDSSTEATKDRATDRLAELFASEIPAHWISFINNSEQCPSTTARF